MKIKKTEATVLEYEEEWQIFAAETRDELEFKKWRYSGSGLFFVGTYDFSWK